MTNEEAKEFLDNLKICISEHPIVADWLVEIVDRKTEPTGYNLLPVDKDINVRSNSSEKPNNCEHITEDGVTCARYPACDDCLDNPLNKVKGSERLVKGKDEPQTEPLPKTINGVRIADAVAWADKWLEDNSVSEMWDMIRTLRDATEWQDEPQTERKDK